MESVEDIRTFHFSALPKVITPKAHTIMAMTDFNATIGKSQAATDDLTL
jgi:hypothetical protein